MSTQPLGIRVVCDSKRSASCREYIDTGAIQTANARIIARHEGWNTLPGSPKRDICLPCIEHALRARPAPSPPSHKAVAPRADS